MTQHFHFIKMLILSLLFDLFLVEAQDHCWSLAKDQEKIRALGVIGAAAPRELLILTSSGALHRLNFSQTLATHPSSPKLLRLNLTGSQTPAQVKSLWGGEFGYNLVDSTGKHQFLVLNSPNETAYLTALTFVKNESISGADQKYHHKYRLFSLEPMGGVGVAIPATDHTIHLLQRLEMLVSTWIGPNDTKGNVYYSSIMDDSISSIGSIYLMENKPGLLYATRPDTDIPISELHLRACRDATIGTGCQVGFRLKHNGLSLLIVIWNRSGVNKSTVAFYTNLTLPYEIDAMDEEKNLVMHKPEREATMEDLFICGGVDPSVVADPSASNSPEVPPKHKRNLAPLWICLGVLAFIGVAGGGAAWYWHRKKRALKKALTGAKGVKGKKRRAGGKSTHKSAIGSKTGSGVYYQPSSSSGGGSKLQPASGSGSASLTQSTIRSSGLGAGSSKLPSSSGSPAASSSKLPSSGRTNSSTLKLGSTSQSGGSKDSPSAAAGGPRKSSAASSGTESSKIK